MKSRLKIGREELPPGGQERVTVTVDSPTHKQRRVSVINTLITTTTAIVTIGTRTVLTRKQARDWGRGRWRDRGKEGRPTYSASLGCSLLG